MTQEFERYPMVMRHPHYRPAVISDDYENGNNRGPKFQHNARPGQAAQFPPVTVNSADQEAYYESRGYKGSGDPVAFTRAQFSPVPDEEEERANEYPKWVYPEDRDPLIVKSREQENQVMRGSTKHEPVKKVERERSAVEDECMAAIIAAFADAAPSDMRDELRERAAELGIDVDQRWGEKKLRQMIERAEAATETKDAA